MEKYKVDLFIESCATQESDLLFTTEVFAQDESEILMTAKHVLMKEHPSENFMKAWCWHIEKTHERIMLTTSATNTHPNTD